MAVKSLKFFFTGCLIFSLFHCEKGRPEFGFFSADLTDLNAQQKNWYQPKVFKKLRGDLEFPSNRSLWFHYQPASIDFSKPYGISISKKSLGWNEIELRNQMISPNIGALIDHFEQLTEGEYVLKIAYNNEVIDQVEFKIIPDPQSNEIDYEAPLLEDKLAANANDEGDDITRLSKE